MSSFIPMEQLPLDVCQSDFIRIFKEKLTIKSNFVCDKPRPDFYVLGDMFTNIVHTKLRHNYELNSDLLLI